MKNILIILVVILLTNCGMGDIYYNIPENEKPVYEVGDLLIYKSNTDLYDTLVVKKKKITYEDSDKRYYYEYIELYFAKLEAPTEYYGYTRRYTFVRINWNDYSNSFGTLSSGFPEPTTTLTIGNHFYPQVFEFHDTKSSIKKIYYTHKYYIIKYITEDDVVWELINY